MDARGPEGAAPQRIRVDVSELAPGGLRRVSCGEIAILVCNAQGRIYAVEDRCSHAAAPLAAGRLRGCLLECPLHGARFDVRDGAARALPARRPIATYPVEVRDGVAEIQLGGSPARAR